jgi:hypothetical protein
VSIGQTFGVIAAFFLLVFFFGNGLIMLISPARWFKLPSYLSGRGSLRERDYMGKPSGRLQIRLLGLMLLGTMVYVVCDLLGINLQFLHVVGSKADALILRSRQWPCVATCLAVIGCGLVMLLRPKWWVMKYMSAGEAEETRKAALEKIARIMSVPIFAIGAYFLYHCIAS